VAVRTPGRWVLDARSSWDEAGVLVWSLRPFLGQRGCGVTRSRLSAALSRVTINFMSLSRQGSKWSPQAKCCGGDRRGLAGSDFPAGEGCRRCKQVQVRGLTVWWGSPTSTSMTPSARCMRRAGWRPEFGLESEEELWQSSVGQCGCLGAQRGGTVWQEMRWGQEHTSLGQWRVMVGLWQRMLRTPVEGGEEGRGERWLVCKAGVRRHRGAYRMDVSGLG
jgi:hypothetical protein